MDWFLYYNGLRHERVKRLLIITFNIKAIRIQRSKRSRRVKFSLDGIRSLSINRTSASLENHRDHFRVQVNSWFTTRFWISMVEFFVTMNLFSTMKISMDFIYLKFKSYEVESHMDLPMIIIYEYFQYCLMLISFFYLLSCFLISSYKSFEKPYSQI